MTKAFIFPGQGSQSIGMLGEAALRFSGVLSTFNEASEVLGFDLWQLCQQGPESRLNQTDITQPAILTASVALWREWCRRGGDMPQLIAGHSLGEYSALVVAGVLSFGDAVALVQRRGLLMQAAVPEGEGAMAAILGLADDEVVSCCDAAAQGDVVSAVNFNAPGQVVIAGSAAAVERAIASCKNAGARRALPLAVSVPSHCALMRSAANALGEYLQALPMSDASVPVVQNVTAAPVSAASDIRENLIKQLYSPVRWTESVQTLAALGVRSMIECGPGKVLAGLVKRIDGAILVDGIEKPDELIRLSEREC